MEGNTAYKAMTFSPDIYCVFFYLFRGGLEANQSLRAQHSAAVSSALDDTNVASKSLLSSIDREYF